MDAGCIDTSRLMGGPIWRYGGKGQNAHLIVPHFPRTTAYVEPFFGAGSVFYALQPDVYKKIAVNDLDRSLVTFFRVLRDRTDDLVRACEATPYARDEFVLSLEHSDDELEEARRVWIRGRQAFAGIAKTAGNWGRSPNPGTWTPHTAVSKCDELRAYAKRLRGIAIDNIDAVDFVVKWGTQDTFIYCDPPYAPETRKDEAYQHEMSTEQHRALASVLFSAVAKGARVAIGGYPSALYSELYGSWRAVTNDVHLKGKQHSGGDRRLEVLWMSYPEREELSYRGSQRGLMDGVDDER